MRLIDEVKKLRDECKNEEDYYNERFDLWMRYKGKSWPELTSDAAACQSVGAIRSELDRIIAEYQPENEVHLGYWEAISPIDVYEDESYRCSECGAVSDHMAAYCHNCGAKMVEYEDYETESGEGEKV